MSFFSLFLYLHLYFLYLFFLFSCLYASCKVVHTRLRVAPFEINNNKLTVDCC
jgi:hypothetical protein